MEKVQYPSVTVCKRQAFDEKIDNLVRDYMTPIEDIEVAIKEDVTKKTDIFYFVIHPNMTESRHTCLTTKNSADPGKPCISPFKAVKGFQYSCKPLYFEIGWCGTKPPSHAAHTDSGYCSNHCKG